MHAMSTT